MFGQIMLASFLGSVFALIGGVFLLWREDLARKFSLTLVSFATGSLIGVAFFDLLPEALAESEYPKVAIAVVLGLLTVFFLEKTLTWHHCHDNEECDVHHVSTSMVMVGDSLHNFIDGLAIALSFAVDARVGIATSIAVFFHEVPQEIGDFGTLLHAGYTRKQVLLFNIFTALLTFAGALIGYLFLPVIGPFLPLLLAFTAGSFLYIAMSDLMPELRHPRGGSEVMHMSALLLGISIIWVIGTYLPE
jgi:zinc and cadmium transporter